MSRAHILMRPGEITTIKQAAHYAGRSEITIRRWCRQYGISRKATDNSPHEISILALEMVIHADLDALDMLKAGNRSAPEVRRYVRHLGLEEPSDEISDDHLRPPMRNSGAGRDR